MKKLLALLGALALALAGEPAVAVPLSDLLDGGTITVGDKIFFDWTLNSLVATDPTLVPDLSRIEVLPLSDQPANPGLRFEANAQLQVVDDNFLDLDFSFRVLTLRPGLLIHDNSLELSEFEFGGDGGVIAIVENVFNQSGGELARTFVQADNLFGIFELFDDATFPLQSALLVDKDIFLAGDFFGDIVRLDALEQRFSQVPTPWTLVLLILGLAAATLHRNT